MIHLGDQLESVNTPRARDVEALKLMRHFEEFLSGEAALSPIFNDNSRLHEAADVILKLQVSQAKIAYVNLTSSLLFSLKEFEESFPHIYLKVYSIL